MTTSNSGKDLLANLLELAIGAVANFETAAVLKSGNRRFSKIEHAMATNSLVFVQNYHMIDDIDKAFIDGITSQSGFQQELKGENTRWVPSRGNLILTGSGPLPIEGHGQQGASTRFNWRYENEYANPISESLARLVLGMTGDMSGVEYLLAWMVDEARVVHGELKRGEYTPDAEGVKAAKIMLQETTPILHAMLDDILHFNGLHDSVVSVDDIRKMLQNKGLGRSETDPRKIRPALNSVFEQQLRQKGVVLKPHVISSIASRGYRYLTTKKSA